MAYKSKVEFFIFIYLIISLLFGKSSFILILAYGNFLRIKYAMSLYMVRALGEVNYYIIYKLNHPSIPGAIRIFYDKIQNFCSYLVRFWDINIYLNRVNYWYLIHIYI